MSVNVDAQVTLPSGARLPVWRNGWASQGFERALLPVGAPLEDGTYVLEFELDGDGRWADVTYQARVLDWSFEVVDTVLVGRKHHTITVDVLDGVAVAATNTWIE